MLPEKFVVKCEIGSSQQDEVMNRYKIESVHPQPYSGFKDWPFVAIGTENSEKLNIFMSLAGLPDNVEYKLYTYEEWKELYYKKDFVLPEKWCIRWGNRKNFEIINSFLEKQPNCTRKGLVYDIERIHSKALVTYNNNYYGDCTNIPNGYTEITFEQFKEHVMGQKMYTVEECREKNIAVYFKTLEEANMLARESGHNKHRNLVGLKDINCLRFLKNKPCPSWMPDNGEYFKKTHTITQFINFEQIQFKQTQMENKFGIKVENNAKKIVEYLDKIGVNHSWSGNGYDGQIYYIKDNKEHDCTSQILEGYKIYTLEEFKGLKEERKIIGYKAPKNMFNNEVSEGTLFTLIKGVNGVKENMWYSFGAYATTSGYSRHLPKEIVEDWEPVYEEVIKSKEIQLGTPARKFTIFKDKVEVIDGEGTKSTFTPDEIDGILTKFNDFIWHSLTCKVTSVQIGCSAGLQITKETIQQILKIQSTL